MHRNRPVSRVVATRLVAMIAMLAATIAVAACSSSESSDGGGGDKSVLHVYAAASLKKVFGQLETSYEKSHPDVDVQVTYGGSSALVNQIKQGAEADVIATADQKTMTNLGDLAVGPKVFARNTLVIATAAGNPKNIENFAALNRPGVATVVCAVEVPCGAATAQVERNTGITLRPKSEETDVSAVLTKVTSGEADAGLVYVTDAKAAGDKIAAVGDPAFAKVVNDYPIATVKGTKHIEDAQMFVSMVLGETGGEYLGAAGFVPPNK